MDRKETLEKYVGKNEKTKIVIKITKKEGRQPVREPVVGEEERKKMMAFWHRKQEIDKKFKEDDDDSYLMADWANPKALRESTLGMSDVLLR